MLRHTLLRALVQLAILIAFLIPATLLQASLVPAAAQGDVAGARDHRLVKRYAGSSIFGYATREFDSFDIATGPHTAFVATLTARQTVEGAVTRLLYVAPEGRSSVEVFRNYQTELAASGFETVFQCAGNECGIGNGSALITRALYPRGSLRNRGRVTEFAFSSPGDVRYLAARLDRPEGAVYVSLATAREGFDGFRETKNRALVLLDVVETKPLEQRMILVSASEMSRAIEASGRAVLYGILFDTDSTAIKPESGRALEEIAKLMRASPRLRIYIVGHTDNQGSYAYNMSLSDRRAQVIAAALTRQFAIPADRLRAAGVGFLAPVASNDTDAGRAKNRRVELVKE